MKNIGYCVILGLQGFYFLEHLSFSRNLENQKIRRKNSRKFYRKNLKKLILETEPDSAFRNCRRRLRFYERNGFSVIEKKLPSTKLWRR